MGVFVVDDDDSRANGGGSGDGDGRSTLRVRLDVTLGAWTAADVVAVVEIGATIGTTTYQKEVVR